MKLGLFFALLWVCLASLVSGCEDRAGKNWDTGYEAGWEGEEVQPSFWASREEKEGHEAGLQDAWIYDTGYYDGYEGKKPEYFNDQLYMDAYQAGKKDKERG